MLTCPVSVNVSVRPVGVNVSVRPVRVDVSVCPAAARLALGAALLWTRESQTKKPNTTRTRADLLLLLLVRVSERVRVGG